MTVILLSCINIVMATHCLSSNHVTALAEDDRGNLWVGTMNGLNRMDLRVDRVYSLNDMAAYKQSPLSYVDFKLVCG